MVQSDKIGKIVTGGKNIRFQITAEKSHQEEEKGRGKANRELSFFDFIVDALKDIVQVHAHSLYQAALLRQYLPILKKAVNLR